jgi:predicted AAA+ superfamily ATPase
MTMSNSQANTTDLSAGYTSLMPDGYRPRVTDARLQKLLKSFGGVEITGPKWCGKTWTALSHASSVDKLDEEATLQAAMTDPSLVLKGEIPHLVDEWQDVPTVWDAARRQIDERGSVKGQLLLTGSSFPMGAKVHHSGAGRIARLRMRPMSLYEQGLSNGEVSLRALFNGNFAPARNKTEILDVARWCCRGGWPSTLNLEDSYALETPREYITSFLDLSIPKTGKSPETTRRLMVALALNLAQAATYKTLAKDMAYGDEDASPSAETVEAYLEVLQSFYLLEYLPGWDAPIRGKQHVRIKPKRFFVDPSLDAALLNTEPLALMRDMQTLGNLFESLCLRDLRIYLSLLDGVGNTLNYYRDDRGLEVDAIIQRGDGSWAALEIKLSEHKIEEGAKNLIKLRKRVRENTAARNPDPDFLAVLIGKGDTAYRRDDGVLVVPLATLAP